MREKPKGVFVPPTAQDLLKARAMREMNRPEVQEGWASTMTSVGKAFTDGHDVVEVEVPEGGQELLRSLGYFVVFESKTDQGEVLRLSIVNPMVRQS